MIRIIIFYVLAFLFTFVLGGIQEAAGISQNAAILPQLGPGMAALLMLLVLRKERREFSILDKRIPVSRYVLSALVPAGGATVIYLINSAILRSVTFGDLKGIPWGLMLWMPLGALGEETGWRGYLHKRLDFRMAGLFSSFIVGLLWASWHVGAYANGALYMAFFLLTIISYTFVLYVLVKDTGFNVLVASIFHLMINVTNLFSFIVINSTRFIVVNGLVWAAIAAIFFLTKRSQFMAKRGYARALTVKSLRS